MFWSSMLTYIGVMINMSVDELCQDKYIYLDYVVFITLAVCSIIAEHMHRKMQKSEVLMQEEVTDKEITSYLLSILYMESSYEGILKSGIEVKVSSGECLAKCATVTRDKDTYF